MKTYAEIKKEVEKELDELWKNRTLLKDEEVDDEQYKTYFENGALSVMVILARQEIERYKSLDTFNKFFNSLKDEN